MDYLKCFMWYVGRLVSRDGHRVLIMALGYEMNVMNVFRLLCWRL